MANFSSKYPVNHKLVNNKNITETEVTDYKNKLNVVQVLNINFKSVCNTVLLNPQSLYFKDIQMLKTNNLKYLINKQFKYSELKFIINPINDKTEIKSSKLLNFQNIS